jgi:predicted dehydrogenase
MDSVRIGVVGTGHLGTLHAKMLSGIKGVTLTRVYDTDQDKAARVAKDLGTAASGSLDELLGTVDAVSIATTTSAHYDVARKALQRGVHVFIEKPITDTIERGEELVALAAQRSVKIQVGHIERFNPAILSLDQFPLKPMFVECHRLAQFNPRGTDVAVVLDLMIHDIDLIMSLVGSDVERVEASGVAVVSESIDIANARLQFTNGCVANVTASRISQNKMRKIRLFQQDAYISIDLLQGQSEVFRLVDEGDQSAKPTMLLGKIDQGSRKRMIVYEQPDAKEVNALKFELELFAQSVRTGSEPPVSGRDGVQALRVAQMIMKAIESHQSRIGSR